MNCTYWKIQDRIIEPKCKYVVILLNEALNDENYKFFFHLWKSGECFDSKLTILYLSLDVSFS